MNITGSFSSWPLSKGVYPVPVGFKLAAHGRRVLEDRSHGRAHATVTTADRHTGSAHPYMKTRRWALLRSQANWWPVLRGTVTASTPEVGPSQPWAPAAGLPALRLRSEDWVAAMPAPPLGIQGPHAGSALPRTQLSRPSSQEAAGRSVPAALPATRLRPLQRLDWRASRRACATLRLSGQDTGTSGLSPLAFPPPGRGAVQHGL